MKRWRAVRQEDSMGCGAACVASVAGISYRDAVDIVLAGLGNAGRSGYSVCALHEGLRRIGIEYAFPTAAEPGLDPADLRIGTIVFLPRGQVYPEGHFVLRAPGGWMDPLGHDVGKDAKASKDSACGCWRPPERAGVLKMLRCAPQYLLAPAGDNRPRRRR